MRVPEEMESAPAQPVVRFGVFELDLRSRELRKHGLRIRLQNQPFRVLQLLLENSGKPVTREEFQRQIWPGNTVVDFELGLNTAVKRLRQALGDSAENPHYVETLPRLGYRFIFPVNTNSLPFSLTEPQKSNGLTPQRLESGEVASVSEPLAVDTRTVRRSGWMATLAALLVVSISAGGYLAGRRRSVIATGIEIHSIAVLPLENLSADPEQEYFADGMTDALVTELAQISSLRVISRTSTMAYKGTRKPLPDIGRELNVDGIVEGSVVRSGNRVRVNAQLIVAKTDRHYWAGTYERGLDDVIHLQNDLAQAIANEIQVKLVPAEQKRLTQARPVDPQAYEFYLKGRYFWNKRTDASVQKSIEYLRESIQIDPNYALAYAGMADAYIVRGDLSPEEKFSKAKEMATKAVQMDDELAEAHSALAMSLFSYDWDWVGAEKEFRRALALNPNYAMAHQWYAQFQKAMGQQSSAMAEIKRARELDPLSLIIGGGRGESGGQYDVMMDSNRKKLELDPTFAGAYLGLGRAYAQKGMYQDAISAFQKGFDLSGGAPSYLANLGYAYGRWGKRTEALKIAGQMEELSRNRYVSPYDVALVHVGLGEKDLAFDWLQKAVADRSISLNLELDERVESIHSDPRFTELIRRIGLPQ